MEWGMRATASEAWVEFAHNAHRWGEAAERVWNSGVGDEVVVGKGRTCVLAEIVRVCARLEVIEGPLWGRACGCALGGLIP